MVGSGGNFRVLLWSKLDFGPCSRNWTKLNNISKSHQQVEDEEIQEIVPVKSEPHENSQQLSNVTESAVALGESY